MRSGTPKFQVADFVSCDYDFLDFYSYFYDEKKEGHLSRYYGIILQSIEEHWDFIDEHIYEVLCLDGEKRYFMESEIKLAAFV